MDSISNIYQHESAIINEVKRYISVQDKIQGGFKTDTLESE